MVVRSNELKKLEAEYSTTENSLFFVYGRKGCDKEVLFSLLTKNKNSFYYRARQCSEEKQLELFINQIESTYDISLNNESYSEALTRFKSKDGSKLVLIVDEVQYLLKNNSEFINSIIALKNRKLYPGRVMIILASSSIVWAENNINELAPELVKEFTETIKLSDVSFLDVVRAFPEYSVAQCVSTYGIIGGVSSYLNRWNGKKSIKENVCNNILNKNGFLFNEAEDFIGTELRELACYETILASIAAGNEKLNDLFEDTGYSRAKISVYMKNLAAFDVIDKAVSFETGGWDNTKKGVYRISNPYINFWFTFIYPNLSSLYVMTPDEFYDTYIEPKLDNYLQLYFVNVCREYLQLLNMVGQLPIKLTKIGTWIGKEATIDIIGQDSTRDNVVGICNWNMEYMEYSLFERLLDSMKKARITANTIYLFSATKFDEKLTKLAETNPSVVLVDMTEL